VKLLLGSQFAKTNNSIFEGTPAIFAGRLSVQSFAFTELLSLADPDHLVGV
jgi:hypothetical protein